MSSPYSHGLSELTRNALLCLAAGALLVGCDALGAEETVILSDNEVTFTFTFQGGDISTGSTNELQSDDPISVPLRRILEDRGFTLQDLRSVTVDQADLQLTFPVEQDLNFMQQLEIFLFTNELSPTRVGRRTQIPDGRRTISIPTESTKNIDSYVRSPVTARLGVAADGGLDDREHEMELTLNLAIEVGGL